MVEDPIRVGGPLRGQLTGLRSARRGSYRVIYAFDEEREAELTMRSVAELAGVSANQATVVLNRLVRLGLVERRDVGAAALVRLVRENEAARSVLVLVDLHRVVLARLVGEAKKIRPGPACLVVFGSFARGETHENSDIDVLAVPPSHAQGDDG